MVKITFPNKKAQVSFLNKAKGEPGENISVAWSIFLMQGSPGVKLELAGDELRRLQAREVCIREAIPNKKSCFYGHFPYPP